MTADISVIIATYNRRESLTLTLESILSQKETNGFTYEIIVVDNASDDGTREMIRERFLAQSRLFRYVFEERRGKSYALNRAVRMAEGRVLAFTDDDTALDPYWLKSIHEFFERHRGAVAQGRILLPPSLKIPSWMDSEMLQKVAVTDLGECEAEYPKGLVGANMAIPALVFKRVGFFCESIGAGQRRCLWGEDNELSLRIRKAGIRQFYVPGMTVYHRLEPWRFQKSYMRKISFQQGYSAMFFMEPPIPKFRYAVYQFKSLIQDLLASGLQSLAGNRKKAFRYELNFLRHLGILESLLGVGRRV